MKFKFSLEPVLKVRKHQEQLQKQKLAEQVSKKNEINHLRNNVQGSLEEYLNTSNAAEVTNIQVIKRHSTHLEQVHKRMEDLRVQMEKVDEKVSEERLKLADAHKKLHILDKLKEGEHANYMTNSAREEQKFMDEISSQSYSR
tara:strand:+ start:199254 stop:199682 length:429 start_codon:yes stop_codon:yes gene_type:complete